jgi:hypothetical protein
MGDVVVAMKGNQQYDTKPGNFPYCKTHNRLYIQALALWLSPARPEELLTFEIACDKCRKQGVQPCNLILPSPTRTVDAVNSG